MTTAEKMNLMLLRSSRFPSGFLRFFEWLPKVFLVVVLRLF